MTRGRVSKKQQPILRKSKAILIANGLSRTMKFAKLLSNFTCIAVSFSFFFRRAFSIFSQSCPGVSILLLSLRKSSSMNWLVFSMRCELLIVCSDSSSRKVLYLYYSPRLILEQQRRHHKRKIVILEIQTVISLKRFTLDAGHIHLYPPINS